MNNFTAEKKYVLVTGGAGYIGTDLVRLLLSHNMPVKVIDRVYFGRNTIEEFLENPNFLLVKKDSRSIQLEDFHNVWAVCDLVALSNDPSGELNPKLTQEINHIGRVNTAKLAKLAGVEKYVLSSSCSVYGAGLSNALNEEATVKPLTEYSKSAYSAEQGALALNSDEFSVSVLRNATVFGLSNRMRFDLVVNLMVYSAFVSKKIVVTGGGEQWRPLVHINDVSRAFHAILETNSSISNGQIFNIGRENTQIRPLAYRIRERLGSQIDIEIINDDADRRDYNIDFSKAKRLLNYEAIHSVEFGIDEIYDSLLSGKISKTDRTSTVKWYQYLQDAESLFKELNIDGEIF